MNKPKIRRGDIYYADLDPVIGSEQGGLRPVLIVQNDIGNAHSPTTIVTPLTRSPNKKPLPTHFEISKIDRLTEDSLILAEQIRAIHYTRLKDCVGHIKNDNDMWWEINRTLEVSLGMEKQRPKKGEIFLLNLCPKCENYFNISGDLLMKKGFQNGYVKCNVCKNGEGLTFAILNLYGFGRNF